MTWEEAVLFARDNDELKQLIYDSYLCSNLEDNVCRFSKSIEFKETIRLLKTHFTHKRPESIAILDLGAGNGISSIAFALNGFNVTAVEPYKSETLGFEAIQYLKTKFNLSNLEVFSEYGESLPFKTETFDIIYARQAMHHAHHLQSFVSESARVLKKDGIFFTCRDHVVNDKVQKEIFLNQHPLHKFYGGENAFSLSEYKSAFKKSGFKIIQELGPLDSTINYSPLTIDDFVDQIKKSVKHRFRINLPNCRLTTNFIFTILKWRTLNMKNSPGRLYSFVAKKCK